MLARIASAACIIGVTLLFVYADAVQLLAAPAGMWMLPIYLFLLLGTAYEFASLLRSQAAIDPLRCAGVVAAASAVAAVPIYYPLLAGRPYPADCPVGIVGWAAVSIAVAVGLFLLGSIRSYARSRQSIAIPLAASTLVAAYCLGFAHFLICIRLSSPGRSGLLVLIGIVVVTKMSDAGAYFLGRAFGRHPLHLVISPKKTVEGAIGGIFTSVLAALLYFELLLPVLEGTDPSPIGRWQFMAVGLSAAAIAVTALIGDLAESLIKRSCDAKDSSRLLPGLGGVWDVTDSLFFVAPLAYFLILAGWIG